jgi:hypothetical protein
MSIEIASIASERSGAELVEEEVQGSGVLAFASPDEPAGHVVRDEGDVGVAFAPGDFVDSDREELVEASRVELALHHTLDDAPDAVPVDADQTSQCCLVHRGGQPADQVLEVAGEP